MSVKAMAWAWEQPITANQKLVLLALADHADHKGICWPGLTGIAEKTGISRRQVQRLITQLEDARLVTRSKRISAERGYERTLYTLTMTPRDTVTLARVTSNTPLESPCPYPRDRVTPAQGHRDPTLRTRCHPPRDNGDPAALAATADGSRAGGQQARAEPSVEPSREPSVEPSLEKMTAFEKIPQERDAEPVAGASTGKPTRKTLRAMLTEQGLTLPESSQQEKPLGPVISDAGPSPPSIGSLLSTMAISQPAATPFPPEETTP